MFQNRKRYGSMRDRAFKPEKGTLKIKYLKFQNRKRYGSMRDAPSYRRGFWDGEKYSFKTVNGMEACATTGGFWAIVQKGDKVSKP